MKLTRMINFTLCVRLIKVFILISCASSKAFAFFINQDHVQISPDNPGHLELYAGAGVAQFSTKNTIAQTTSVEKDTLQQQGNPFTAPLLGIGIGYAYPLHSKSNGMNWLPFLKPMVNLRYQDQHMKGKVYQFQDPEFYNYNYTISFASTRVMLDLALGLFTYKRFSGYVLGGGGVTWNHIKYRDQPIPTVAGGMLELNKIHNSKLIPEAGGGVSYDVNRNVCFSLEYLYVNFGTNRTSANGKLNGFPTIIPPIAVPITSQSVQFILTWKI